MKTYITIGLLVTFVVTSLVFVSCYIEPSSSAEGTVSIQLNGQDLQSGYTGDILRVSLYLDGEISITETDNPSAYFNQDGSPISTYYTVSSFLPPIPIGGSPYEDFPGPDPTNGPFSGSITVDGIIPDVKYRILLESMNRFQEEFFFTEANNFVGLSGPFFAMAGETVAVDVNLQEYFFSG
ncbi:hypothetical protein [Marispirochaeta aestuarii]|uniref:hypothetical protein n=1 Tax=Marispirochaeta aestuarii TaxID=1963862 RepID=UPI002ABD9540|nr:hypothetical protein [Marispirochaeta aestuarii]